MSNEEQVEDEQRARLLEGLAASIREKGLAQTQLSDIVRHARASRRTFYKHFPDKDACFVELSIQLSDVARTLVREAIDPDADWDEQIGMAIDAFLDLVAADPAIALTFASPALGPSIVRAQRDQIEQYALLAQEIAAGDAFRRAGIAQISLERAYMLLSGLLATVHRAVERGEDPTRLSPDFKAVFAAAILATTATVPQP